MQRDLFGLFRPIASDDIDSLPDPSFRDWARKKYREGILNILLQDLVKAGISADMHQALKFLSSCSEASGLKKRSIITLIDLGIRPDKRLGFLLGASRSSSAEGSVSHKHLGSLSHTLINRFCKRQKTDCFNQNFQQPLFGRSSLEEEQMKLWTYEKIAKEDGRHQSLKDLWAEAAEAVRRSDNFFESYCSSIKYMLPLLDLLQTAAGVAIQPIFKNMGVFEKWLWVNGLLTWSNMFFSIKEGRLPLPEIFETQALNRNLGLSGGRIDGIEIISDEHSAYRSPGNYRVQSIGQLADFLRKTKRNEVVLKIIEWKFAIGDNVYFRRPILPSDVVESPFEYHKRQIERYITLGSLDEYFVRGDSFYRGSNFWEKEALTNSGCVIYLFPVSNPVIHEVALNSEGKRSVFSRDIVSRWEDAKLRAVSRGIDRRYVSLFSKNTTPKFSENRSQQTNETRNLSLPYICRESAPIAKIIDQHRIFLDKYKIIEDKNGKNVLHLNRLVACIESGIVKKSSNFKLPQGGLVSCPVHKDEKPSLSVRPLEGFFYCFARSCKISGRLALGSIPQNIKIEIRPESWIKHEELFKDLFVPDDHHKILEQAQLLLSQKFYGSEGENYVREKRGIDPDLVYEMGVGFGTQDVISGLLDQGFSVDELKGVGLVKFSTRISSQKGLCRLFLRRGMKLAEIKRETGKTADGRSVYGLPYFPLEGRVTFPLKVKGRHTNIYARSIYPDAKVLHIKLSTGDSGVRHGAFNEEILYSNKCEEVAVTEGVFDAISLKQMFMIDAVAVIGTRNSLIVELLVQSGKNIAIALDNDQGGRLDTERLKKSLIQTSRFKKRVRDMTGSFISGLYGHEMEVRHRGLSDWRDQLDWDDWNTLLIKHGKWLS